jgi:hypothetical protein
VLVLAAVFVFAVPHAQVRNLEPDAGMNEDGRGGRVAAAFQGQGSAEDPDIVVARNGDVFFGTHDGVGVEDPRWSVVGRIGLRGPSVIVHVHKHGGCPGAIVAAYASNGDYFQSLDCGRTWRQRGNVFGR